MCVHSYWLNMISLNIIKFVSIAMFGIGLTITLQWQNFSTTFLNWSRCHVSGTSIKCFQVLSLSLPLSLSFDLSLSPPRSLSFCSLVCTLFFFFFLSRSLSKVWEEVWEKSLSFFLHISILSPVPCLLFSLSLAFSCSREINSESRGLSKH